MYIECRTDKGRVRDINEDYILVLKSRNYSLLVAADGMGGHNGGEIASKLASVTIRDYIVEKLNEYDDKEELVRDAMIKANSCVFHKSLENDKLKGMGTTVTCCLVYNGKLYIGHVGDSRAYIINEKEIRKITEDHSYVQELINNGSITENEALEHPQRNLITRAIGVEKFVVVDTKIESMGIHDYLFLCTDGLTSYVNNEEIHQIVMKSGQNAVDRLIDLANERGGSDNISIIIARKEDEK